MGESAYCASADHNVAGMAGSADEPSLRLANCKEQTLKLAVGDRVGPGILLGVLAGKAICQLRPQSALLLSLLRLWLVVLGQGRPCAERRSARAKTERETERDMGRNNIGGRARYRLSYRPFHQ